MNEPLAREYCGQLSSNTFKKVMHEADIKPRRISPGRLVWVQRDLDRWIDQESNDDNSGEFLRRLDET